MHNKASVQGMGNDHFYKKAICFEKPGKQAKQRVWSCFPMEKTVFAEKKFSKNVLTVWEIFSTIMDGECQVIPYTARMGDEMICLM